MINFQEELKKFRPSADVDDIEKIIGDMDMTDMNDIFMSFIKKSAGTGSGALSAPSSERHEV